MNKNSRYVWCCLSILTLSLLATPLLTAQSANPLGKSPVSSGVLAARAVREGRLVPQNGGFGLLGPTDLVCSPAPCVFTPVRASPGGQPANESPLASNPRSRMQFLSGANDYNCSNIQGFYSTDDGGATWTHTCSKGSGGEGDPVVAYDLNNNAFAGGIQNSNYVAFTSTDNGKTWSNPITVSGPILGGLADKPWMEADLTPSSPFHNNLYMSGTQFDSSFLGTEISVSRSSDAAQTWKTVAVDTKQSSMIDQFSDLAVGSDGTVYVTWQRCPPTGSAGDCGGTTATFFISKSTDGGATWSTPSAIATATLFPDTLGCYYGCLPNTGERISNIPAVAAYGSGAKARVYVVYYDYSTHPSQIKMVTSTDGGNTFGAPVTVAPSTSGDQFFPWVAISRDGNRVAVSWLDRRNDPANLKYQPYLASTRNGQVFNLPQPLSTAQSNPNNDGFGGFFMGDYRTSVWSGQSVYAVWMDSTTGTNNMQDEFGGAALK